MAKSKSEDYGFWDNITEEDFLNDAHVVDEDIGAHNIKGMTIFSINDNLARHLVRVADSLKPVERRILYGMYRIGALPGKNMKRFLEEQIQRRNARNILAPIWLVFQLAAQALSLIRAGT